MGAKLSAAMESCVNNDTTGEEAVEIIEEPVTATRKKKPCRGRRCSPKFSKKCPSVQNVKKNMGQDMKGFFSQWTYQCNIDYFLVDLCILNKLGWIDAAGDAIEEVMVEDIKTLPSEVSGNLGEENISSCAEKIVSKVSKHHKR